MSDLNRGFRKFGFASSSCFIEQATIEGAFREFPGSSLGLGNERPFRTEELQSKYPFAFQLLQSARQFAKTVLQRDKLPEIIQNQAVLRLHDAGESKNYHIDGQRHLQETHQGNWDHMPVMEIIVGIPLIDIPSQHKGNLAYLPGAHRVLGTHIYQNWRSIRTSSESFNTFGPLNKLVNQLPRDGEQFVTTTVGDVYAIHGLMPHRVLQNEGPDRPVWYFRFGTPKIQGREGFREFSEPLDSE